MTSAPLLHTRTVETPVPSAVASRFEEPTPGGVDFQVACDRSWSQGYEPPGNVAAYPTMAGAGAGLDQGRRW